MFKFKLNNIEYVIKEVEQEEFWEYEGNERKNQYFGQSHFLTQEIWLYKKLSYAKKRQTLYHELTHAYIREYLTLNEISPTEEVLCDIAACSHDIIHEIVEDYFKER